ncbi:MAG: MerR family transcriptional regulator [Nakamurella sp.]
MTGAGASARSAPAGLSIGAVLARLKPEYPDLTISKIRFLEAEDLVTPERTQAGYRQFSNADISRLRYILTAQRDQYLPLKVIKEQLDAIERGVDPGPTAARHPRSLVIAHAAEIVTGRGATFREVRLTRDELIAEAGLSEADLAQAESFGLVDAARGGYYETDAVLAARTVAELLALGLEPRHLRTLRSTAQREAAMVAQLVAPTARKREPDARQRARADASNHAATLLRLHALLVRSAIGQELGT